MFKRKLFLLLFLFLSILSLGFSKPKKNAVTVPTKVQEKINNTEESPKSWYICELKGKTKAGNVVIGPVEQRELILLVWIANSIVPNKNYCIAKNKTYISKNPESFFKEEFANIKSDINEFGVADTYEKYFFTNYLTRSLKLSVDGTPLAENPDEEKEDEELPLAEGSQLTRQMISEQEGTPQEETAEPEVQEEVAEETSQETPQKEEITKETEKAQKPEKPQKEEKTVRPELADIIAEEPIETLESQLQQEEDPTMVAEGENPPLLEPSLETENVIVKEKVQEPKEEIWPEKTEPKEIAKAEPVTTTVPEPVTTVEQIPQVETVPEPEEEVVQEPEPIPEPAAEEERPVQTSFELPISTTPTTTVNRYQRENLLDYAPKKTPALPSDDDYTSYQLIGSPDAADSKGVTLLMKAAKAGNNWELKNLINYGAKVNLKDNDGWTALMYAVRFQENTSIIDLLIDSGAEVKAKNNYNVSALMLAATYNGNPEILRKLLSYYSPSEKEVVQSFVLMLSDNYSSDYSKAAKVDTFIEKSIALNSFYNGKTPLMYAAQYCSSTIVIKKLLDYGAGTTIRSADGKTAFDYAKENPTLPHDDIYWKLNKK